MMTNNSVRISPKVRAIVYAVWIAAGLVVAAIATYAAAMGEPAPHWLGGASAVLAMVGTACGFTALAHVNSGATPDATTGQTVQDKPAVTPTSVQVSYSKADDSTDATSTDATSTDATATALTGDSQTDSGDATAVADDAPAPHSPLSTAADAAATQSTGSTPSAGTVPAAAPVATTATPAAAPAAAAPAQPAVTPVASI